MTYNGNRNRNIDATILSYVFAVELVLGGLKVGRVTKRYAIRDMNSQVLHVVHEKDPWIVEEDVEKQWFDNSAPVTDKKSRRKSWHAIKFERKRKKGVVEAVPTLPEVRQKRPSWWNIFAGQQWPRYVENYYLCIEVKTNRRLGY